MIINSSSSLISELDSYKYLDDYEYYLETRIKQNAMRKFENIMQSIKTMARNNNNEQQQQQLQDHKNDSPHHLDIDNGDKFPNFNKILRRHRKRFKQYSNHHHHH